MVVTRKTVQTKIEPDIKRAETLPAEYYRSEQIFELARERIFARSWQLAITADRVADKGQAVPWMALDGYLNEPLLFIRGEDDKLRCLSNVCTHRGNLLVEADCQSSSMRCRYHGRRFGLDGKFLSAPGFEKAENFPTANDNLAQVPVASLHNFLFASIDPAYPFEELVSEISSRLSWLDWQKFKFDPALSRDRTINANWVMYVENYLEGLHVPYVHPGLASIIEIKDYRYELQKYSNLQIGLTTKAVDAFSLPSQSQDAGQLITAYYFWLFPNMMFNFYPWGLSIDLVTPLAVDRTRIQYFVYVSDESRLKNYSPETVDEAELQDLVIVQQVQKGMQSRFYKRGRYSPDWERTVHQFHTLLTDFLAE